MARNEEQRPVHVYADWVELGEPALLGVLYSTRVRGKEVFSFEYDPTWLQHEKAQHLDPDSLVSKDLSPKRRGFHRNKGPQNIPSSTLDKIHYNYFCNSAEQPLFPLL